MLIYPLLALCCVTLISKEVFADGENEVKRGVYPYMAFIYYPDETILDSFGSRFIRGAVLIHPKWLISSAIDHSMADGVSLGFPRKTLLARLGAITIDVNFALNEDEDEQEREVIEVVRPTIHNVEMWWFTDITLLKTLLPFNQTSAVAPHPITNFRRDYIDKTCFVLVYAKRFGNVSEDKLLTQLTVEMLPPSMDNCGHQFSESTMTCALDTEETKSSLNDPDYCQGNNGSPLICDNKVVGLQTYIENHCKTPHLYQLLASWETLITCATQERYTEDYCVNICSATSKDISAGDYHNTSNADVVKLAGNAETTVAHETTTSAEAESTLSEGTSVESEASPDIISITLPPDPSEETETTTTTVTTTTESATPGISSTNTPTTTTIRISTGTATSTTAGLPTTSTDRSHWPLEHVQQMRKIDDEETMHRRPSVEAQQIQQEKNMRSAADMNMYVIQMLLSSLILKCII